MANNTTFNPKTDATSTPLVLRKEIEKEEKGAVYHPYAHMYPSYPPPFAGYPPHPYLGYPGYPSPYNPPTADQKMPPGPSSSDHPGYPPMPHAMAPYPYPFPPPSTHPTTLNICQFPAWSRRRQLRRNESLTRFIRFIRVIRFIMVIRVFMVISDIYLAYLSSRNQPA